MSAPKIAINSTGSMNTIMGDTGSLVQYELFSDQFQFDNWKDWVVDAANKPSSLEKDNASKYENYVIKFYCQLAKQHNACGLQHSTHGAVFISSDAADGSIAANSDTSQVTSNTYVMKKTEVEAWIASAVNLSSTSYAVPNTSIADPFFQFFYCGGSRDHNYTCYKY